MDHKIRFIDKTKSLVGRNFTNNNIINIILAYLSLNTKHKIVIYKIMRNTIYNQAFFRIKYLD